MTTNEQATRALRPIEELTEALDVYTGFTKFDLVDEAVERREEITPHLLAILERIKADPEAWIDEEHDIGCYALVLLAHFQEVRAHRLIVDIFGLPEPLPYDLFGDFIGQTLPALLIRTCGGSLEGFRELILNREATDYCRWSACSALAYATVPGIFNRDEVVGFLVGLLREDLAEEGSSFWTGVAATLAELHPGSTLELIRTAYETGLVGDDFAPLSHFEELAALSMEESLAELRLAYEHYVPEDIHDYFRWWQEPGKEEAKRLASAASGERKEKAGRRKKNKQAKKSRRKNR
jgi:hypothetical protein